MSPPCDHDFGTDLFCMTFRLMIMQHHFEFGHKRMSGSKAIVRTELGHTKGPDPLSDSVARFDQLLRETSRFYVLFSLVRSTAFP